MKFAVDLSGDLDHKPCFLGSDTLQHMYRVGKLAERLLHIFSKHTEAKNGLIHYFITAAFYHDIGKAWVPANILTKPGKLLKEEYSQIQMHTVYASRFLSGQEISSPGTGMIFQAAVFHHERWDGKGYPFGLQREQIPFIARAVAVCDGYDAMVHDRPYRSAYSHDQTCEEISRMAGTQYDPQVAQMFLESMDFMTGENVAV